MIAPAVRTAPHNYEAEQALLGTILTNNRSLEKVSEFLRPEHFADPVHGRIYDACLLLAARNQIANPVTLKTYLANDAGLRELGGDGYLAQLSRAVEQREDKRPQLSDLRESGSIEQDADVVMFVYREQYYLERAEPGRRPEEAEDKFNQRYDDWQKRCSEVFNTAETIVAKQRHGPVGAVRLFFDGQFTKFGDLDNWHDGTQGKGQ